MLVDFPKLDQLANTPFSFGGVRRSVPLNVGRKTKALSGVPAAIQAVLDAVKDGSIFYVKADIKSFFTKIPKSSVLSDIGSVVRDDDFMDLLAKAVVTELENMAELRERAQEFPIEDIGVAQGSSLSTLIGNITLAKFDLEMNKANCRCVRYIDDFIILGATQTAVNAQLRKARRLLHEQYMEFAVEKSLAEARPVKEGVEFLGIRIVPGLIRPTSAKQTKLVLSVAEEFEKSRVAFTQGVRGKPFPKKHSLISTLNRVDGIIDAWGKAYWFCIDEDFFLRTDQKIRAKTRAFLGAYRATRERIEENKRDDLLGISKLREQARHPFKYPKSH